VVCRDGGACVDFVCAPQHKVGGAKFGGMREAMVASRSPRERGWLSRIVKPLGVTISTQVGLESLSVTGTKVGGSVATVRCRCFLSQL